MPDGALAPAVALRASRVLMVVAAGAAVGLAAAPARRVGAGPLLLSAAMIALAWGYSAPPLRLCARGLGELGDRLKELGNAIAGGFGLAGWEAELYHLPTSLILPLSASRIK